MELLFIALPGVLGGVILALLTISFQPRFGQGRQPHGGDEPLPAPSPHLINMAHVKVAGGGGLGMVAMAIVVAIIVQRIRWSMAVALLLGMALAAGLIAYRRRQGPLGSPTTPGAHSMLPIDPVAPQNSSASETRHMLAVAQHLP